MKDVEISEEQRVLEGARLRAYLVAEGVTQDELADEMDVAQGTISKWCNGTKPIPAKRLYWLGARLHFNPLEFRPNLVELMGAPVDMNHETKEQIARIVAKVVRVASLADAQELERLDQLVQLVLGEPKGRPDKPPKNLKH